VPVISTVARTGHGLDDLRSTIADASALGAAT
jgi:hypothetical protein